MQIVTKYQQNYETKINAAMTEITNDNQFNELINKGEELMKNMQNAETIQKKFNSRKIDFNEVCSLLVSKVFIN